MESAPTTDFSDMLKTSLNAVNETQQKARELKVGFEYGTGEASLAEVMIAAQKADLSFRAVTEVRNKLVTAYQDIMNMPV
ncbi:MAG: flagellar hook-basal body complex protein FliE [Gammaproteobacteria bacterium]|nr:flagellar hook-basal body complex protein FliE [Gammaproteobacteria bacterium]MDH3429818.1 flagellar hook-basal body complex protein FliE [Gammaproteobacteria bacterium]MDH3435024.1 flagellar hook-basal body complex protein FliE [Gammaproteobacteria bacterium]